MGKRVIDLTGTKLHRTLRNIAAETTLDDRKRHERREAYNRDFDRCPHGGPSDECHGRDDRYGGN